MRSIQNTSCVTSVGERVLRFEFVIPVNKSEAWDLMATAEGWRKWAAPVVSMDFRIGGLILTNYDPGKTTSDPGTIRLPILNYLEKELITFKVVLDNEAFDRKVRQEDENMQELVQLFVVDPGNTRIVSSMIGWGKGPEWERAYDFFVKGNEWTYNQLIKLFD
jgi:hypothetical protein